MQRQEHSWPVRASGSLQKSAEAPLSVQRLGKRKARQEALEAAYAVVDKRDGNRCRVTGKHLDAAAVDPSHRREHHHLRGRRVRPDWRERPERICLVSRLAHDLITNGWIDVEGDDARKPLFFSWTALAKSRPLQIKRWNPRGKE